MDEQAAFCNSCGAKAGTVVQENKTVPDIFQNHSNNINVAQGHPMQKAKSNKGCLTIFLWVFFLPIMAIISIVKSQKMSKKAKIVLVSIIAGICVLISVFSSIGNQQAAEQAYNNIRVTVESNDYLKAQGEITGFLKSHPNSKYAEEVKKLQISVDAEIDKINSTPTAVAFVAIQNHVIYTNAPFTLELVVTPTTSILNNLIWNTSDSDIATVKNGIVTGVKDGIVVITVKTNNNLTASIELNVKIAPESIALNETDLELTLGEESKIIATILPEAAEDIPTWTCSPAGLVDIDSEGNIIALKTGEGILTASTGNGITETCSIKITQPSPVSILNMKYDVDFVGGVEWTFKIRNNTDKQIKYVTLQWSCYNGVGDLIKDDIDGKSYVRLRYTGPLDANSTTGNQHNTTKFYNNTLKSISFTEVMVEYMDGTTETITRYHTGLFPK